jgi:DNA modification methylase
MAKQLQIEYLPLESINENPANPRHHPASQLRQLAKIIKSIGFINPIILDQDNQIVAGHARKIVADRLGLAQVPVIRVDHLTEDQLKAYMLADNKLVENAEWDDELLCVHIQYLVDLDFDMEATGFSSSEVDLILQPMPVSELEDPSPGELPEVEDTISQSGDVFELGNHRILCADIRCQQMVQQFMGELKADVVLTDPPYNVAVEGHVSGLGMHTHDEFVMASGEMDPVQFQEFLETALANMVRVSRNGAVHFVFMDWRHISELLAAANPIYHTQLNLCVWNKTNAGMGSLYRSQHELVCVFRVGKKQHQNNVALGKNGRYRTNVWTYAGMNSFSEDRDEQLAMHPTVKPVALLADAMLDVTGRGDLVFDGFLGSGSTLLAAEHIGRIARGVEIDPRYVDVAIQRWQSLTGQDAVHVETGLTFTQLSAERLGTPTTTEEG